MQCSAWRLSLTRLLNLGDGIVSVVCGGSAVVVKHVIYMLQWMHDDDYNSILLSTFSKEWLQESDRGRLQFSMLQLQYLLDYRVSHVIATSKYNSSNSTLCSSSQTHRTRLDTDIQGGSLPIQSPTANPLRCSLQSNYFSMTRNTSYFLFDS